MSAHTTVLARKVGSARRNRVGVPMIGDDQTVREKDDFYGTPSWVTLRLLHKVQFPDHIWEPAAGEGHIADVLQAEGHKVSISDLVDRGIGAESPVDFLLVRTPYAPTIITNPPFKLAQEFAEHALTIGVVKTAMLLKLSFAQGKERTRWLMSTPLSHLLIVPERITFKAAKGREPFKSNFMDAYAWFVWDQGHKGPADLGAI